MTYDSRQDKHGQVDLTFQAAWLKHMDEVWPEAWTEMLLDLKEFLSKYQGSDKLLPKLIASLHLTCAADALANSQVTEEEKKALLAIFHSYLDGKMVENEAPQRTDR